jgi:glycosyltransferase involved in cell wall biosynthesis
MRQAQHQEGLAGLTVLHVTQPVEGGVARVVTDLAAAQGGAGARVVVAGPLAPSERSERSGRFAAEVERAGARVAHWSARRSPGPGLHAETRALARLVRDVRPDLLHLHSAKAGLAGRIAVRGSIPTVFQPHAWSFDAAGGPVGYAALRWERFAARWSARVVCVSEAERLAGERAGIRAAWSVIPNGVDLGRYAPAGDPAAVRASLPALSGLPAGAPLVVCVGRLCPQKGQDVLLRAWPEVTARVPGAHLAVVGDGPDRTRLLRDAPQDVVFAGAAADTVPWYQAADLVVLPSRWEGMALAPLEAMACGRPVVLTDVSGARECLPPGDAAASVVPVADPAALASAMVRGLTAPAPADPLPHVRASHDIRRTAASVSALYGDVLALPSPERRESALR